MPGPSVEHGLPQHRLRPTSTRCTTATGRSGRSTRVTSAAFPDAAASPARSDADMPVDQSSAIDDLGCRGNQRAREPRHRPEHDDDARAASFEQHVRRHREPRLAGRQPQQRLRPARTRSGTRGQHDSGHVGHGYCYTHDDRCDRRGPARRPAREPGGASLGRRCRLPRALRHPRGAARRRSRRGHPARTGGDRRGDRAPPAHRREAGRRGHVAELQSLGAGRRATEFADELAAGNAAYEARFGRVFIIRAAGRTRAEILAELERRLQLDDATELLIVGEQLRDIALLRLEKLFGDAVMSHVTTHVLDAALGRPAAGISVALSGPTGEIIATGVTDADGRVADTRPRRAARRATTASSSRRARTSPPIGSPTFYPRVTVDFIITDPAAHYHVPLLLSPFAYSHLPRQLVVRAIQLARATRRTAPSRWSGARSRSRTSHVARSRANSS